MRHFSESLDERHARRLRRELGGRRWLLSWYPRDDGWLARLSCPERAETIERDGPTRRIAIDRATAVLTECLASADH